MGNYGGAPTDPYDLFQELYNRALAGDQDAIARLQTELNNQNQEFSWNYGQANQGLANSFAQPFQMSPEEQSGFLREGEMNSLLPSAEELSAMGLSPDEITRIMGNPYAAMDFFNQASGNIYSDQDTQEQRMFDTTAEQDRNIRGVSDRFRQNGARAIDSGGGRMRSVAYNPELNQRGDFLSDLMSGIDSSSQEAKDVYSDPKLGLSEDFANNYEFGQKDRDNLEYLANRSVGTKYDRLLDTVKNEAAAGGGANPMAIAALADKYQSDNAADSADAAVSASLQGKGEQLNRMKDKEGMRLQAEQGRAGLALPAMTSFAALKAKGYSDAEAQRIEALGRATGYQLNTEGSLLNDELQQGRDEAQIDSSNEQYLGSSRLGAIERAGAQRQANNRYIATSGADYAGKGEDTDSGRARTVAENRQQTAAAVPQLRYNMGMGVSDRMSSRVGQTFAQRLAEENARRGYLTQQSNQNLTAQQNTQGRIQDLWNQRMNAGQAAANAYTGYATAKQNTPSTLERILGAASGVAGAVARFVPGGGK